MKMPDGLDGLTEKEKETLRLLVTGHDAKSIARELGLSVHTINDRLRDTRRKIGVTSSREAARILAQAEDTGPNKFGAKKMGVSDTTVDAHSSEQPPRNKWSGVIPAWLGGGMLVLSVVVAVAVFMSSVGMSPDSENGTSMTKMEVSEAASIISGEQWLKLVDNQNWSKSWSSAGSFFRSQISEETWSATILSVRNPLGTLVSRSILKVTKATSLPGAPDGEYELIEFQSNFTNKSDAKETLVLMKEENTWKTVGYFIR